MRETLSTTVESLQNVGWHFRRKAIILAMVCLVVFVAFSLSYVGRRRETGIMRTSHSETFQTTGSDVGGTQGNHTRKSGPGQPVEAIFPQQVVRAESMHNVTNIDGNASSSSDDNYEYSEDEEESVLSKPQGEKQRRLPQAIIIGVKKGGTRALLEFLRVNPQVVVNGKEMHFFDRHFGDKSLDWYRKTMPYSYENQVTIEKTPGYFVTPEVPRLIRRSMSPNTKFLVVVRNPVQRAISDHAQSISKGKNMPFEEKALLNYNRCLVDDEWSAIQIGQYAMHLENWLKHFPLKNFHFVNGDNMVIHPGKEMEKVQDFLQIKRTLSEKSFVFNKTKGFPCLKVNSMVNMKCLGENKGRRHQSVDPYVLQCLEKFYRPYNRRFYEMTGINFHWENN